MKMGRLIRMGWIGILTGFTLSCRVDPPGTSSSGGKPVVCAVNYPLQYFAQRIAGDLAEITCPVPSGTNPAFWSPSPEVILAIQSADLILLNGANYAGWVSRTSLPVSNQINTSSSFRDRYISIEGAATHAHGPGGDHTHGETAFTTWLDFSLALEQARAVRDAFMSRWPDQLPALRHGFEGLQQDLSNLDRSMDALARSLSAHAGYASHPVYQYWARRYQVALDNLHWEPDRFPDAACWESFQNRLNQRPARWMIWEAEPAPETARRLNELNLRIAVFSPCAGKPTQGDFLSVMRKNLENLTRMMASLDNPGVPE